MYTVNTDGKQGEKRESTAHETKRSRATDEKTISRNRDASRPAVRGKSSQQLTKTQWKYNSNSFYLPLVDEVVSRCEIETDENRPETMKPTEAEEKCSVDEQRTRR